MAALGEEEKKKAALDAFFGDTPPTLNQIEEMRDAERRANILIEEADSSVQNATYVKLAEIFENGLSDADYDTAAKYPEKIAKLSEKADEVRKAAPAEETVDIKTGGAFKPTVISSVIACALGVVFAFIFVPVCIALIALGALLLCISVYLYSKEKKSKVEREKADARVCEAEREISSLNAEIEKLNRQACEFIAHFGSYDGIETSVAIADIIRKRDLYLALKSGLGEEVMKKEKSRALANEMKKSVREFLMKFALDGSRPFDELSQKLLEHTTLCRSIERIKESMREFCILHSINPDMLKEEPMAENAEPLIDRIALDEQIREAERQKTLAERQYNARGESLERLDELYAERELIKENIVNYRAKLDTVELTKKFLTEAKDNLTARYIHKTKAAFDKYVSIIGRELGSDFKIDTSFAVMKSERGEYKPQEAYSRGTRDFIALAARLAIVDALYEGEMPFIILDDPFAFFDDEKLKSGIAVLSQIAKERQIIYLTCSQARV